MQNKINIIALVAGIATLLLVAISIFVPWWQFTVGTPALATVKVSPINMDLSLFGTALTFPLVFALNVASALTLTSGAIILLIYAVKPNKSYSSKLLGFGYKKPLYAVVLFVVALISATVLGETFGGFSIPLSGSGAMTVPQGMLPGNGVNVSVAVSAGFEWPFYFAIVVAGLCVAARVYHRKIVSAEKLLPPPPTTQ